MNTVFHRSPSSTKQSGFTLFELLVSISIIGLLLAMAIVSYTTAQQGGRDARRRADIKNVQNAMEQYYAQSGGNYSCTPATLIAVLPGGFPKDPQDSTQTITPVCTETTSYCICDVMERNTSGNSGANCTYGSATTHFCASSQQ